jgi:hypothetical protein
MGVQNCAYKYRNKEDFIMLRKSICKKIVTIAIASIIASIGVLNVSNQSVQAKILNWNNVSHYVRGMENCSDTAVVVVNTTLDARYEPNGRIIGAVYNGDKVHICAVYTGNDNISWALVEYPVTGTNDTKMGWVHAVYLYF